jgi:hypothetical protein
MGAMPLYALPVLVALGAGPSPVSPVERAGPAPGGPLSAEDARYLGWLVEDFLFDPRRAQYVRVLEPNSTWRPPIRGSLLESFELESGSRDGWLVRGTNGDPDRVYFADGESIVVPAARTRQLDFEAVCARRYQGGRTTVVRYEDLLDRLGRSGAGPEPDLVLAAWLHRRGYDRLAVAALEAARDTRDDPRQALRNTLARRANDALVRAFAARADAEAVAHAARLFELYPDLADQGPQARQIVADIARRQRTGLGSRVPPAGPPRGFVAWDGPRRAAFLIAALDEVEGGTGDRWEMAFRPDARSDWRITGLAELGDAAVPALIDAFEHDNRLTRRREREMEIMLCCNSRRDQQPEKVIPVRDVVRDLLRTILRVNDTDPTGPVDADEDASPAATAERYRRYWARYGRLALPDRLMAILTDPAAHPDARREAAESLVGSEPGPGPSWSRGADRRHRPTPRLSPLVARYSSPTVAEAIFAAMDRDRAALAGEDRRGRWERVEADYVEALVGLGDPRAGPELARRAARGNRPTERARLARAAADLGVAGPLVALAREVATGTVPFPPPPDAERGPQVAQEAVRELLDALIDCDRPETDDALYALADPGHPYYPLAERAVLADPDFRDRGSVWKRHPFCLAVLRNGLADRRPTGGHSYRRGEDVEDQAGGKPRWWTPPGGADPAGWAEHVERRAADDAADRLAELVVGLPEYHPLRRDADRVLAETRALLGRYARRFRRANYDEQQRWDVWRASDSVFVPDIRPLGRPATAADVTAGRAIFELNGAGKVADAKLPAWVVLKADAKLPDAPAGLVVQAEVGPDGKVVYGVIFRHSIRTVPADEVERLEPYPRD